MRTSLTSLFLLASACTPSQPAAPSIEPPPPGLAPGTVAAYVRVDGCQGMQCEGTVIEIAGRGPSAPVLTVDGRVRFAVDTAQQTLRQGTAPAFRAGAVLHLVLSGGEEAVGGAPGPMRVAEVRTPGLHG